MTEKREKNKKRLEDLKKTVKLKLPKGKTDSTLQETALILMHHQQALIELLIEKGVFSVDEFEKQVDREIARSFKL